jgi:large conductance mechanosensitive channel
VEGFRKFILRGNVVDLAIGVAIGAAFTAIVSAIVTGLINPVVGFFGLGKNLNEKSWCVGTCGAHTGHVFGYGAVISSAINFLIIAAVLYFFVVLPVNALMDRYKTEPEPDAPTKDCPECLSKIPEGASRCAFCGVEQPGVALTSEPTTSERTSGRRKTSARKTTASKTTASKTTARKTTPRKRAAKSTTS